MKKFLRSFWPERAVKCPLKPKPDFSLFTEESRGYLIGYLYLHSPATGKIIRLLRIR